MTTVVLGQNRFVDCDSIIGYHRTPVLRVLADPPRVELTTPADPGPRPTVHVDGAGVHPSEHVRIVESSKSFGIFWNWHALAVATALEPNVIHLTLDLRPVGINIYDDGAGLHIGGNTFAGNVVTRAAVAINLGD